jgi:hypothetical protein
MSLTADDWSYDGTLDRIHHALYLQCREKLEREASPAACVCDVVRLDEEAV